MKRTTNLLSINSRYSKYILNNLPFVWKIDGIPQTIDRILFDKKSQSYVFVSSDVELSSMFYFHDFPSCIINSNNAFPINNPKKNPSDVFFIGNKKFYEENMKYCDYAHLLEIFCIDEEIQNCEKFIEDFHDAWKLEHWEQIMSISHHIIYKKYKINKKKPHILKLFENKSFNSHKEFEKEPKKIEYQFI